jgi:hypothetical protein
MALQLVSSEERIAEIAKALFRAPAWWRWMPAAWRQRKLSERLRRMELFDGPAYLRRYPDVARQGMDPLTHYLDHGYVEGRVI